MYLRQLWPSLPLYTPMSKHRLALLSVLFLTSCSLQDPAEPGQLVPKTVDEDARLPALTLRSTKLHAGRFGDPAKPLLIVLHGGPGEDHRYLLPLIERYDGYSLLDHYSMLFYDQRGSGLSRRHQQASDFSYAIMGQDLAELIEQVAPNRKVVLIGHSWGGQLAALYLNQHPEKVAGVVFIEPGEFSGQIARDYGDQVTQFNLNLYQSITWSRELMTAKDQQTADYYLGMASLESDAGSTTPYHGRFWRKGFWATKLLAQDEYRRYNWDYTTNLKQYPTKVLFINGDKSVISDDFQIRHQVNVFSAYEDRKIANCDHAEMLSNPAYQPQVISFIKRYLDEVLP